MLHYEKVFNCPHCLIDNKLVYVKEVLKLKKRTIVGIILLVVLGSLTFLYVNGLSVIDEPAQVQWVSHTEYWEGNGSAGDQVATIVRITDYKGDSFGVDGCTRRILNPDKSVYLDSAAMSASGIAGNWYANDPLPITVGTYEQEVTCTWSSGTKSVKTSQSFHVNEALSYVRKIYQDVLSTNISLASINGTIVARIAETNQTLFLRLNELDTNLTSWVGKVNASLSEQLSAANANISTTLAAMNGTIMTRIGSAETTITTSISEANASISNLVTTLSTDIKNYLVGYLPTLNMTAANIFNDTQWIVTNAINHGASNTARFDRIDANLSIIEDFCSNPQTSSSRLCIDLVSIKGNLTAIRNEEAAYFQSLNETTTNTWNLLSGSIASNINILLADIGVIKGQTTQINATVEAIRKAQVEQVYAKVLS